MPAMFRVTYAVVTPESAENRDVDDHGFISVLGRHMTDECEMTLHEAMRLANPQEDCGRWWCEADGRFDYPTGAIETRSIHPPRNITESSYRRVSRLLGFK